jgi:hypothetical protein
MASSANSAVRWAFRAGCIAAALSIAAMAYLAPSLGAANSPTFRDCALAGGIDPDFVRLMGADVSGSSLTVPKKTKHVSVKASESSLPGDDANRVTLHASVKSKGLETPKLSGEGTGHVTLKLPLKHRSHGRKYTIGWSATFDNGNHACPSASTPQNTAPMPYVVKVS